MKIRKSDSRKPPFDFPAPMYYLAKLLQRVPAFADVVHSLESSWIGDKVRAKRVDRPIYVTGMARAGTTVTLEMLSNHPDIASHRYLHMVMPYAPHWFQDFADATPIMLSPTERVHQDELMVNRNSPEAVEEIFWQRYFPDTTDELRTNMLTAKTSRPYFERFYREHINKLVYNQHAKRYLAKNNYNISRLEYILKMFPDAKFLLVIRNPFTHIASLAKQDVILGRLEARDPRLMDWTKVIGHREFGSAKFCINVDNTETVRRIRSLWKSKTHYVEGWALYWSAIYASAFERLKNSKRLSNATLMVKYEDLCMNPAKTIDAIIDHVEVDRKKFEPVKKYYMKNLRLPSYYSVEYEPDEVAAIRRVASQTASMFGYNLEDLPELIART
jgi:hypothetical protein